MKRFLNKSTPVSINAFLIGMNVFLLFLLLNRDVRISALLYRLVFTGTSDLLGTQALMYRLFGALPYRQNVFTHPVLYGWIYIQLISTAIICWFRAAKEYLDDTILAFLENAFILLPQKTDFVVFGGGGASPVVTCTIYVRFPSTGRGFRVPVVSG